MPSCQRSLSCAATLLTPSAQKQRNQAAHLRQRISGSATSRMGGKSEVQTHPSALLLCKTLVEIRPLLQPKPTVEEAKRNCPAEHAGSLH